MNIFIERPPPRFATCACLWANAFYLILLLVTDLAAIGTNVLLTLVLCGLSLTRTRHLGQRI